MFAARWMALAADGSELAFDAAAVIGLRLLRLSMLDARAADEARLMVEEKLESAALLQWQALTGQLGHSPHAMAHASMRHYRGKIASNRKRLSGR
ncbi:MAG TPA: hypothetical protein VFP14_00795 [Novosphingobium sp.]|nr:hypothetical protein [Novosphingobium sp.]